MFVDQHIILLKLLRTDIGFQKTPTYLSSHRTTHMVLILANITDQFGTNKTQINVLKIVVAESFARTDSSLMQKHPSNLHIKYKITF